MTRPPLKVVPRQADMNNAGQAVAASVMSATAPPDAATPPDLREGASGPIIEALQRSLRTWGFDPGAPTGRFDATTREALSALQRKIGVQADGVLDKSTRAAIKSDLTSATSKLRQNALAATLRDVTDAATAATAQPTQMASAPAVVPFYKKPAFFVLLGGAAIALYAWNAKRSNFAAATMSADDVAKAIGEDDGDDDEDGDFEG